MKTRGWITSSGMLLALLLAAGTGTARAQATFQSAASGAWNSASTWTRSSGSDADGIPDANDTVRILNGHSVTVGNSTGDCAMLTVDAGGTLSINGTGNIRINSPAANVMIYGALTMSSSGRIDSATASTGARKLTIANGGTMTISGSASNPRFRSFEFQPTSTVVYSGSGAQYVIAGVTYGNLTLSGSGTKTAAQNINPPYTGTIPGGLPNYLPRDTSFRVLGTLSVSGTNAIFDCSTYVLHLYFDGDVFINSGNTIDASVGIVVTVFSGSQFVNNGTFLASTTPGYNYTPSVTYNNTAVSGSGAQSYYDLIVNGPIAAGGNFTVSHNVTIMPGGTFDAGSGLTHTVGGNWTNNGTFNCGTSTIVLNGTDTVAQSIGASTFSTLVLNNPRGAILTGNVVITAGGTATLTQGNITTGGNSLTINNPDPAALTVGTNRITGTVVRAIAPSSSSAYAFLNSNAIVTPSGTDNPASIAMSEHPGVFSPSMPPSADTGLVARRYYSFTFNGAGPGFSCSLRLPYLQNEVRGSTEAFYVFWTYGPSGWVNRGAASVDTSANYVQQSGLPGFSQAVIAENAAALPIQLSSFSAEPVPSSDGIRLVWTTLSETNNFGFYIERSTGTTDNFTEIPGVFIPGHGTTTARNSYSWTQANLPSGVYYYRLRQVDLDGTPHPSDAVMVEMKLTTGVENVRVPAVFALEQNYPNPFNPSTRIQFTVDESGPAKLQVYNLLGQEIATLFTGEAQTGQVYTVSFDGAHLTNGAYFYRLTSGEKSTLKKMLLLK